MATYVMTGKYSAESIKGINAGRTGKAREVIEKNGGKIQSMYALLGERDLLLVVDLPDNAAAVKASLGLTKLTGIGFSTTPAVAVDEFDRLAEKA